CLGAGNLPLARSIAWRKLPGAVRALLEALFRERLSELILVIAGPRLDRAVRHELRAFGQALFDQRKDGGCLLGASRSGARDVVLLDEARQIKQRPSAALLTRRRRVHIGDGLRIGA